jgi:hypothetical protein
MACLGSDTPLRSERHRRYLAVLVYQLGGHCGSWWVSQVHVGVLRVFCRGSSHCHPIAVRPSLPLYPVKGGSVVAVCKPEERTQHHGQDTLRQQRVPFPFKRRYSVATTIPALAVPSDLLLTIAWVQEQLRLSERRVADTIVGHLVDAADNDDVDARQVRNDLLQELGRVPDFGGC